jgi:hypothetical protein
MPLQSDKQFKVSWPANTTPQAPDGSGSSTVSLCGYTIANSAGTARAVKFYDKATAPTVGTDVPKRTVVVAAGATVQIGFARGKLFLLGLWVAVTVNAPDSDNTAPAAGDVLLSVDFQR